MHGLGATISLIQTGNQSCTDSVNHKVNNSPKFISLTAALIENPVTINCKDLFEDFSLLNQPLS